jgi:elongation factor Tu
VDLVDDPELIDLVELETRDLLTRHGFDGASTVFVRGSARGAVASPHDPEASRCISQLLAAMDQFPEPQRLLDRPFRMSIESVFTITGRGTVVTGKIDEGQVQTGDKVEIVGLGELRESVVTSIEAFNKVQSQASAGDNIGLLLRGIRSTDVQRGQVVTAPRSLKAHQKFKAEVYVLSTEEGGRHTPFYSGYAPQFFFRTADTTGQTLLGGDAQMAMPGDNVTLFVDLNKPMAIHKGSHFAIREGNRTVGSGIVTEVLG